MNPKTTSLRDCSTRLLPVRGLVTLHNRAERAFDRGAVQRWLYLNRVRYRTAKVDILDHQMVVERIDAALSYARTLDMRASLRTLAAMRPPAAFDTLGPNLFDVFLVVDRAGETHLEPWLDVCRNLRLPMRVQFPLVLLETLRGDIESCIKSGVVTVVHLMMNDDFAPTPARTADWTRHAARLHEMATLAEACGVEFNVLDLPFCQALDLAAHIQNSRQRTAHHQHYAAGSLDLAQRFYVRSPVLLDTGLVILQKQGGMSETPYEGRLLRWILDRPRRVWLLQLARKLLRILGRIIRRPSTREIPPEHYETLAEARQRAMPSQRAMPCRPCSLRRICDGPTKSFRERYPGATIETVPGEIIVDPMEFALDQRIHLDAVDEGRLDDKANAARSVQRALNRISDTVATRIVTHDCYDLAYGYSDRTGAGLRWFALSDAEYRTEALGRVQLPCTIAAEFTGGLAEYVGFAIGRWGRVVCHSVGFKQEVVLHAETNGRFVLLNNGRLVQPINFSRGSYLPERLSDVFEPALVAAGIDMAITTQDVRIWERVDDESVTAAPVRFSVLIVCNRYARRLQAALAGIAHQQATALAQIEVIVAYTPNVDASEDVLESLHEAFPELRIVRAPFDDSRERNKGYQVNEAARLAEGEWIILLDADIILPPDFLFRLDMVGGDVCFVAPDGRKMLSPEATAKILLGEIRPWEQWDELMQGPGEWRRRESEGLPVGFCQCVRAHCLREIPYVEVHGYEYADMKFAQDIVARYGPETWLENLPVLHLDHGGSQWYGTHKHR